MTTTPPARPARKAPRRAMAPVTAPAERPAPPLEEAAEAPAPVRLAKAARQPAPPEASEVTQPAEPKGVQPADPEVEQPADPEVERPADPEVKQPAAAVAPPVRQGLSAAALALVLVAVLALGGAAVALFRAHQLRDTDAARNLALVDTGATTEVVGQVSAALNRVFSYDYTNPKPTQDAAAALLTGDAAGQYKTLFDALQSKASGQQLTLQGKSVIGGVSSLTPDSARLLVFLDQSSTRASDKSTSTAAAQLSIEAVRQNGIWKISQIRPL